MTGEDGIKPKRQEELLIHVFVIRASINNHERTKAFGVTGGVNHAPLQMHFICQPCYQSWCFNRSTSSVGTVLHAERRVSSCA